MFKYLKNIYYIISVIFLLLTIFELFIYFNIESNYFGLWYLLFNLFIIFMLFSISYNYQKSNSKIRFSKVIVVFILGVFSSFFLFNLLSYVYSYIDTSNVFIDKIFIIKVIKTIIYVSLLSLGFIENKLLKK